MDIPNGSRSAFSSLNTLSRLRLFPADHFGFRAASACARQVLDVDLACRFFRFLKAPETFQHARGVADARRVGGHAY